MSDLPKVARAVKTALAPVLAVEEGAAVVEAEVAAAVVDLAGVNSCLMPGARQVKNAQTILKQARLLTDSVNVAFSCGKESILTLDLCCRTFGKVSAFFMYLVPGLSFQERYLDYIENRFGVKVIRLPHWQLGKMLATGTYRPLSEKASNCPVLKVVDIEAEMRARTGIDWFAWGHRAQESLERNAMLKKNGGIDRAARRIYPVAWHSRAMTLAHIRHSKIQMPPEYHGIGRSFGCLWSSQLKVIRDRFPEDFRKIIEVFPFAEADLKRDEYKQIPKV